MKKNIFIRLLTVFFIFFSSADVYAAQGKNAVNSVVSVTAHGSFGAETVTGIVIGKDGYILTDYSCVFGSSEIEVSKKDENSAAEITAADKSKNLVLIKLKSGEKLKGTKPARIDAKEKKAEAEVFITDYRALNDEAEIQSAKITDIGVLSTAGGEPVNIYTIDSAVTRDNRLGAVTDKKGALAGACLYDGTTDKNKVITAEEITAFLDGADAEYTKYTPIIPIAVSLAVIGAAAAAAYYAVSLFRKKKAGRPSIEGINGEYSGQVMPLSKENITIGRASKQCQIVILNGKKVSRCHCSVKYDNIKKMFVLTDLSSTHGTYLTDGTRLEPNVPRYISSGTSFMLGSNENVFKVKTGGDY